MNTFTFTDEEIGAVSRIIALEITESASDKLTAILVGIHNKLNSRLIIDSIEASKSGAQEIFMQNDAKEKLYPGGKVNIIMPSFDHDGNIKFTSKEKEGDS